MMWPSSLYLNKNTYQNDIWGRTPLTGSRPIFPLKYHYLVCIETYLFNVAIDQLEIQNSNVFLDLFLLFVCYIEYRYKYYKTNIRYTSVLKCCYNDIWLWFFCVFSAETEMMYALLIYIWQQHWNFHNYCYL